MGRLNLLQLDSVPVVVRTQYLPPFSRLGCYDRVLLDRIAYSDDEWFEAWAHEASLLPVGDEPLLRWQKQRAEEGDTWKNLAELARSEPGYVAEVLAQVRDRDMSFLDAVLAGVFTVPGDGSIDFRAVARLLAEIGYEGWVVVEAEQDPAKANPLTYARIGYAELSAALAQAGVEVSAGSTG